MALTSACMLVCASMFFNSGQVQAIDVEILQPTNPQPGPEVVIIMIPGALIPGQGYSNLDMFGCHCLLGQDYAFFNKERFDGVLLFASFLPIWQPVATYPLPVLTISGDLDGLVRITKILDIFTDVSELNPLNRLSKPVVIVSGMNHGQFINPDSISDRVRALDIKTDVDSSITLGEPLTKIRALDQNKDGVSIWSIRAQELVAGIDKEAKPEIKIQNENLFREPFLTKDPIDTEIDGVVKIETFTYLPFEVNTLGGSSIYQTPLEMMVKMVSQDSIREILPSAQLSGPLTCRQINEEALNLVLGEISETARERWETRSRKITFIDDQVVQSQDIWFSTPLTLTDPGENGGLDVTSVSWSTNIRTWPFQIAGVQYCKLISPYRIAEWIYIDSLRNTEP